MEPQAHTPLFLEVLHYIAGTFTCYACAQKQAYDHDILIGFQQFILQSPNTPVLGYDSCDIAQFEPMCLIFAGLYGHNFASWQPNGFPCVFQFVLVAMQLSVYTDYRKRNNWSLRINNQEQTIICIAIKSLPEQFNGSNDHKWKCQNML